MLRIVVGFLSPLKYLKLFREHFISRPFQFIIHYLDAKSSELLTASFKNRNYLIVTTHCEILSSER